MEKLQADINIKPNELEALKGAEVIRLTDGQEFVRKDVASKIMANYAQQEVSAYKERLKKEVETLKQWTDFFNDDDDGPEQKAHVMGALAAIKKVNELIDTL